MPTPPLCVSMSYETVIYGYIEGSTFKTDQYRLLQRRNIEILKRLPLEFDEYPGISREMFSWPPQKPLRGGWRAQVIHYGGSFKNIDIDYSEISIWIEKFERLLEKLYWISAIAHFHTELLGVLTFDYRVADEILDTYRDGSPAPSSKWDRQFSRGSIAEEFKP